MAGSEFYINISIQTKEGPKKFGQFDFGADREAASALFKQLKGSSQVDTKNMLYVELMETKHGLPVNIDIITCDLQELGLNTMLITQEIFRLRNLKE